MHFNFLKTAVFRKYNKLTCRVMEYRQNPDIGKDNRKVGDFETSYKPRIYDKN